MNRTRSYAPARCGGLLLANSKHCGRKTFATDLCIRSTHCAGKALWVVMRGIASRNAPSHLRTLQSTITKPNNASR